MGDRRAPDIEQRLLAVYKEQQCERGADEDSAQPSQLPATTLSPSEARLSRLLGCTLLVTLSDRRRYSGRLHCLDRHSLVLADCVQQLTHQHTTRDDDTADGQSGQSSAHAQYTPVRAR